MSLPICVFILPSQYSPSSRLSSLSTSHDSFFSPTALHSLLPCPLRPFPFCSRVQMRMRCCAVICCYIYCFYWICSTTSQLFRQSQWPSFPSSLSALLCPALPASCHSLHFFIIFPARLNPQRSLSTSVPLSHNSSKFSQFCQSHSQIPSLFLPWPSISAFVPSASWSFVYPLAPFVSHFNRVCPICSFPSIMMTHIFEQWHFSFFFFLCISFSCSHQLCGRNDPRENYERQLG